MENFLTYYCIACLTDLSPQQTHYEYPYSPKKKHRSKNCTYIGTRCEKKYSDNRTQNTCNHKPYIDHALSRYHNNVHDNKDGVNEIHLRVLLTDPNGWKGSYENEQEETDCIKLNEHTYLNNNQV